MVAGIALGLAAAAVFAAAAALQHAVTHRVATRASESAGSALPVLHVLPRLLRQPMWLAGLAGNVVGFGLHAAALHRGDLTVVQVVLVAQLLFALPLGTLRL